MPKAWILGAMLFLMPTLGFAQWTRQPSGTARRLKDVWFIHPSVPRGWVVGDSGTILSTTNLGATWSAQTSPTTQPLYGVGWAVPGYSYREWASAVGGQGTGVILHTTDSGNTWNVKATPTPVMYAVSYGDSLSGWAAGDSGQVWRTTDGGLSWAFQAKTLAVIWFGVWFSNPRRGWTCGTNGAIMATTDGGASWSTQASGTSNTLRGVCFRDSLTGCVVGDSGKILRTTNGGGAWSPISSGTAVNLNAVYLTPIASNGFAVGDSGKILGTGDLGATWVPDFSGTTQTLRGVWCWRDMPGMVAWAVGDSGTILFSLYVGVEAERSTLNLKRSPLTLTPNPIVSFAKVPGYESERFALYDISGRKVGTYRGDRIGEGLGAGVYFLRSEGKDAKPLRIVKVR